jgi:hypothetical protein
VRDKEWALVIFDEVHHLPANQFSRFATLNTRYRIGLCLHKRTTVTLEDGSVMKISEIVDNKLPVKVLSFNHGTGQIEAKPILDYYKREVNEILKVKIKTKFGIKEILCSPDHEFFVSGKYKKASELIEGDETTILVHPHCTLNNPAKYAGDKISHSLKGREFTENHRKNISKSLKGKLVGEKNPFFGKTHDRKTRNKLSKIHKGKRYSPNTEFKKGHTLWKDERIMAKRLATLKITGCLSGKNNGMYGKKGQLNPNWQGGVSYWRKEYSNSLEYKKWRRDVFKHDNFTCTSCGSKKNLHAHHKKLFSKYPEFRLDVNNGTTLCFSCHNRSGVHAY